MITSLRHPACERRSLASIVIILASFLVLSGCETSGGISLGGSSENRAERMARNGDHAAAAGAYMGLAVDATGTERDRYTLLAVEQYLVATLDHGFNASTFTGRVVASTGADMAGSIVAG